MASSGRSSLGRDDAVGRSLATDDLPSIDFARDRVGWRSGALIKAEADSPLNERPAGELVSQFDLSAPAISQHLKVLHEAGLVTVRAEGQSRVQALNPDGFGDLEAWLEKTRSVWSRRLDALERELRAEDERNEPKRKHRTSS